MALRDNIHDAMEFLYQYIGGGDESKWNLIARAINQGTTPYRIKSLSPFNFPSQFDPTRIAFGGIEGEARFVGAAGMNTTAATSLANGVPRIVLPDAATTDIFVTIELEEWWLKDPLSLGMEWVNDAAGTGNVRLQYEFKEIDIGQQGPASGDVLLSRTVTEASLGPGITTTSIIALEGVAPITLAPGPLASHYALRVTRLGNDGADTLAGPIGVVAMFWARGGG